VVCGISAIRADLYASGISQIWNQESVSGSGADPSRVLTSLFQCPSGILLIPSPGLGADPNPP